MPPPETHRSRADLITKLRDDIVAVERPSVHALVSACCQMCEASGLLGFAGLSGVIETVAVEVGALFLAKAVLVSTGDALCLRRVPTILRRVLSAAYEACMHWLFPVDAKWRRSSAAVEPLWAAFACCRSLVWLSGQWASKWPAKAAMLLSLRHRQALWRPLRAKAWEPSDLRAAVDDLLHMQLQAICPQVEASELYDSQHENLHALYSWVAPCGYYVGIARAVRKQQRHGTGVCCKWLEHLTAMVRSQCPESGRLGYVLMRRVRPGESFFMVCRLGPEWRVRAMESLEISSRRPNANVPRKDSRGGSTLCPAAHRRRPPRHVRGAHKSQLVVGPFDSCTAASAVVTRAGRLPSTSDGEHVPVDEQLGFHGLYLRLLRAKLAVDGVFGPLDLYDPCNSKLFARWCGTKGAVVLWRLVEKKWSSGCGPSVLYPFVQCLHGKGRKAMATRCLNCELRRRGLPDVRGVVCRAPRHSMLAVFRESLRVAVLSCPWWTSDEKHWVLTKVRITAGCLKKHRDKWNAVRFSKSLKHAAAQSCASSVRQAALNGQGMCRVDKVWDVPERLTVQEDLYEVKRSVSVACACLKLPSVCHGVARRVVEGQPAYDAYTADMHLAEHEVLVPDDKNKNFFWKVPCQVYAWLLFHFAMLSPTWVLSSFSTVDAERWCRQVLQVLLPARLQRFLMLRRYKSVLPYYYCTIKSKCFSSHGRTCNKPLHSCVRKIVSFASWPLRRRWRAIHRGLETVLKCTGIGDEIWCLRDACRVLDSRMRFAGLSCGAGFCRRCGCSTPSVAFMTADAGQFYGSVKAHHAISAARQVFMKAERITGHNTVTVLRGKRRVAFLGGHCRANVHGFVFAFVELVLAFAACMFVTFCSLGDMVFRLTGLPIGGVVSKVAASYVLALDEHRWYCDIARRQQHGFSTTNPAWDREVARARYTDDIIWISNSYCHRCLAFALTVMYSVPFDVSAESNKVIWLDLCLNTCDLRWTMKPTLWTLPPPWGAPSGYAHSFLCGRLRLWSEVPLDLDAWLDAATRVLIGFRDAKWPKRAIRAAVYKAARHCSRAQHDLLLRLLVLVAVSFGATSELPGPAG